MEPAINNVVSTTNPSQSKSAYWAKAIAEWESSGKVQKQFCLENKLSYTSFSYWRTRLNKGHGKRSNQFQRITITPGVANQVSTMRIRNPLGYIIDLPLSIEQHQLKQICQCLGELR